MRFHPRRLRLQYRSQFALVLAGCVTLLILSAPAQAGARHASGSMPRPLRAAALLSAGSDRALVWRANTLRSCLRAHTQQPRRCRAQRAAVQRAGSRLAAAQRLLARIARGTGRSAAAARAARRAPRVSVAGHRLLWTRVGRVSTYLLARKAPGQAPQYSVVTGTSITPPPAPGATVQYSVRSTRNWSAWAGWKTIAYASPESGDMRTAPAVTVSGQTLAWNAIAGVKTYVLVRRAAGQPDQYSVVAGTSTTPVPAPGASVRYSVRTAVFGSAWSATAAISYPALPPAPPVESPAPSAGGFQPGVSSGWVYDGQPDLAAVTLLGARTVRVEFPIEWTPAQLERTIAGYAAKGIRVAPLASFNGRLPSATEAQNLAGWARAYGPGGTFWSNRSDGRLAMQTIEFGNETSGGYQYGDNAGAPSYMARAQTYAMRLKEPAQAISAARVDVRLLAVAEDWTGDWMNGMFAAVPNLGSYVGGWVSHPYGTGWKAKFDEITSHAAAHGAPSTIPIDVTEWGLSSADGRCLSENYGWNACMSYQEAADTLRRTVAAMRQALGGRLALFIVYQIRDQQAIGATTDREAYFGLLQHELQPKGAYTTAVEELLAS